MALISAEEAGKWVTLFLELSPVSVAFYRVAKYIRRGSDAGRATPRKQEYLDDKSREIVDWLEKSNGDLVNHIGELKKELHKEREARHSDAAKIVAQTAQIESMEDGIKKLRRQLETKERETDEA